MKKIKKIIRRLLKIDEKSNNYAVQTLKNQNFFPIQETLEDDIFIAGFPKSGNTWMQNLITGIILNSTTKRITPQLVSLFVPDEHALKFYKRVYPTMVFKTHNLPSKRYKRVIHLVRDGRNAMISYYKMEINRNKNYKYSLEEMIKLGKGVFPSKWHIHTSKWLKNPFNADIITVKYEDLITSPIPTLKKICAFLKIDIEEDRLQEIYNANNINILREKILEYGWDYDDVYKNKKSDSFFRKGGLMNYKDEMDTKLEEFFIEESYNELKRFSYLN